MFLEWLFVNVLEVSRVVVVVVVSSFFILYFYCWIMCWIVLEFCVVYLWVY